MRRRPRATLTKIGSYQLGSTLFTATDPQQVAVCCSRPPTQDQKLELQQNQQTKTRQVGPFHISSPWLLGWPFLGQLPSIQGAGNWPAPGLPLPRPPALCPPRFAPDQRRSPLAPLGTAKNGKPATRNSLWAVTWFGLQGLPARGRVAFGGLRKRANLQVVGRDSAVSLGGPLGTSWHYQKWETEMGSQQVKRSIRFGQLS